MKCPFCGTLDSQVIDSRLNEEGDSIRRRRKCGACNKRFTTYEAVELRMPQVVKQNGKREEFSREKVRTSFMRALHKRPVSTELVDAAIERIGQKLLGLGEREIDARRLGEMVMDELRKM
ncbi:MAG: transcriptional regulator NrdR, partial [Burkholderiales bacterium]